MTGIEGSNTLGGIGPPTDRRLTAFLILFLVTGIASVIAERLIGRYALGPKDRRDRSSFYLLVAIQSAGATLLVITALFWSSLFCRVVAGGIVNALGIAIAWSGILIRLHAKRRLGKFFTARVTVLPDHHLIEEGLYRRIRHPGYLGGLLFYLGLPLSVGHYGALLWLTVPVLLAFIYRIRVEERALVEALGDAYRQYQQRTARLIPFLW
jgi:protein-S-isoprenylcysteine O-methyltransferase